MIRPLGNPLTFQPPQGPGARAAALAAAAAARRAPSSRGGSGRCAPGRRARAARLLLAKFCHNLVNFWLNLHNFFLPKQHFSTFFKIYKILQNTVTNSAKFCSILQNFDFLISESFLKIFINAWKKIWRNLQTICKFHENPFCKMLQIVRKNQKGWKKLWIF